MSEPTVQTDAVVVVAEAVNEEAVAEAMEVETEAVVSTLEPAPEEAVIEQPASNEDEPPKEDPDAPAESITAKEETQEDDSSEDGEIREDDSSGVDQENGDVKMEDAEVVKEEPEAESVPESEKEPVEQEEPAPLEDGKFENGEVEDGEINEAPEEKEKEPPQEVKDEDTESGEEKEEPINEETPKENAPNDEETKEETPNDTVTKDEPVDEEAPREERMDEEVPKEELTEEEAQNGDPSNEEALSKDEASKEEEDPEGDNPKEEPRMDSLNDEPPKGELKEIKEQKESKELQEQHYSTRGRHSIEETEKPPTPKEQEQSTKEHASSTSTTSFLDSLGDEERRVRTRFVPEVDGFHVLYKSEVKSDLHLARSIMSCGGGLTSLPSSRRARGKKSRDDDNMSVDDDGNNQSEDEINPDFMESDNKPSRAFLPPPDGDDIKSPHIVEATSAYNPPRPPESAGAKKKHRMLRWERRPQDVEIDLDSYRKTVDRTRTELQMAQAERERIETVSNLLRCHFLTKLRGMNEEGAQLNRELGRIQSHCVKAADLLQSRTRSRGVGKGSYVMRDVLNILKQRGFESNGEPIPYTPREIEEISGIGGIDAQSFADWDRSTQFHPVTIASGWILPGNKVTTPYGEGTVVQMYGADMLDPKSAPAKGTVIKTSPKKAAATPQHGFGNSDDAKSNGAAPSAEEAESNKSETNGKETNANLDETLAPRVCVKLPFGFGFFPTSVVTCKEDISMYSDAQLVQRWKHMAETAALVGGSTGIVSMDAPSIEKPKEVEVKEESDPMDVDEGEKEGAEAQDETIDEPTNGNSTKSTRFLPFGAGLFPTSSGRGTGLELTDIVELEKSLQDPLFYGEGVLGKVRLHYNVYLRLQYLLLTFFSARQPRNVRGF